MDVYFELAETNVVILLDNHNTSRDLLTLLPQKLEFEDYGKTEKISYLPRKLTIKDSPEGYQPVRGDLAYYAPWGNIAIFCKDFTYSSGLVKLGHVSSGLDTVCQQGKYAVLLKEMK
jgi:hypothetical protein